MTRLPLSLAGWCHIFVGPEKGVTPPSTASQQTSVSRGQRPSPNTVELALPAVETEAHLSQEESVYLLVGISGCGPLKVTAPEHGANGMVHTQPPAPTLRHKTTMGTEVIFSTQGLVDGLSERKDFRFRKRIRHFGLGPKQDSAPSKSEALPFRLASVGLRQHRAPSKAASVRRCLRHCAKPVSGRGSASEAHGRSWSFCVVLAFAAPVMACASRGLLQGLKQSVFSST